MRGKEMLTGEAAAAYGFSPNYVARMCKQGIIKARKIGRDWLIDRASMEAYASNWQARKAGPKKKEVKE